MVILDMPCELSKEFCQYQLATLLYTPYLEHTCRRNTPDQIHSDRLLGGLN